MIQSIHQQVRSMHVDAAQARATDERAAVMRRAMEFGAANPDVVGWLMDNDTNNFAISLSRYLNDHGTLTQPQIDRVREHLAYVKSPAATGTAISVGRIEQAFEHAREQGLKRLRLHLDTFKFKPAKEGGRNAGGIYVTEGETYLGKVLGGKFLRTRECSDEQEQRILAAAADPEAAAKAYGQRTGTCSVCGRELTAEESIERFIGPICSRNYGF
jgi:hypothetical protein